MADQEQRTIDVAIFPALQKFYHGDIPGYIVNAGKFFLTIQINGWQGTHTLEITISDVAEYYSQGSNISGLRTLQAIAETGALLITWHRKHWLGFSTSILRSFAKRSGTRASSLSSNGRTGNQTFLVGRPTRSPFFMTISRAPAEKEG